MGVSVQSILQDHFQDYARSRKLPLKVHRAAKALMTCRTPEQGGHVQSCPDGHESHVQYHSCRNRSCPRCNSLGKERWVESQQARLLPVDHYHVIFTLPHELQLLWKYNTRWFADTLFRVVRETLMALGADSRHLGGTPGIVMSLHTWGRNLSLHPHIHSLVTGGALTASGEWKEKKKYLFPYKVVSRLYRGKLLDALDRARSKGKLVYPQGLSEELFPRLMQKLWSKEWQVSLQPPYEHGRGVVRYLSRYVKGGPISDHRIKSVKDGRVSISYKDHRDNRYKVLRLKVEAFLDRLFNHIFELGQHTVRHCGLYGHQGKAKRDQVRELLGAAPEQAVEPLSWEEFLGTKQGKAVGCCSVCGQRYVIGVPRVQNSIYKYGVAIPSNMSLKWTEQRGLSKLVHSPPGEDIFLRLCSAT